MSIENKSPQYDSLPEGVAPSVAELEATFSDDTAFKGVMSTVEVQMTQLERLEAEAQDLYRDFLTSGKGWNPTKHARHQDLVESIELLRRQHSECRDTTNGNAFTRFLRALRQS
ncbi:MAG TPA: hypothetical protein PKD68_03665 [Candidatus Saccharibacteria bacterium]|nr:hypothetical protein [Candidatus Saccharibacteria bacterium]